MNKSEREKLKTIAMRLREGLTALESFDGLARKTDSPIGATYTIRNPMICSTSNMPEHINKISLLGSKVMLAFSAMEALEHVAYDDQAFSNAWSSGSYDASYEGFKPSKKICSSDHTNAAYFLGFYSSYETHEIPENHRDIVVYYSKKYAGTCQRIGITHEVREAA